MNPIKLGGLVLGIITSMMTSAWADTVTFKHKVYLKAKDRAFSGPGQVKLAILDSTGNTIKWSTDSAASGVSISEPSSPIAVQVTNGEFEIQVGDESIDGMPSIDASVMVSEKPLKLRTWFSDGVQGFKQLKDTKLIDVALTKIPSKPIDYTIYVNGQTGKDNYDGLTTITAKKTISAAVDIIPERVKSNITVDIAPGVYKELVSVFDINVMYGKKLFFIGDDTWTASSGGSPSVIIDGADSGSIPVRDHAMHISQCTGVTVEGIGFRNGKISSLTVAQGDYTINRCHGAGASVNAFNAGCGFLLGPQFHGSLNECSATQNASAGFALVTGSRAYLTGCIATNNTVGIFSTANSIGQLFSYNLFKDNAVGIQANSLSDVGVSPGTSASTRTKIENSTQSAVVVNWSGQFTPADAIFTNNAQQYIRYYGKIIGVDPQ